MAAGLDPAAARDVHLRGTIHLLAGLHEVPGKILGYKADYSWMFDFCQKKLGDDRG